MTADIITFPGAERPPAERPQITRESVRDSIIMGVHLYQQGRGPEDLPADMDPDMRETMEVVLNVIREGVRS